MSTTTLTERQVEILEHALGNAGHYRNYFATDERGRDYVTICELVEMGLMERGREIPGGLTYFHVTDAGKGLAFPGQRPPLRYCVHCDQRRRGSKQDRTRCSHCRNEF
jgi:hypothetical protein